MPHCLVLNGTKIPENFPMVFSGHTFSIGWLKTIKRVSIIFDYGKIYRRLFPLRLGSTFSSQRDYALGIPQSQKFEIIPSYKCWLVWESGGYVPWAIYGNS